LETLIDNDELKITVKSTASKNVVFCFTGVGHSLGGIDVQREEFFRISESATTIFISDKQRSWGNNINFGEVISIVGPYIKGKQIFSLGNSMGGFLAIVASRYFTFNSVVAFVPQYTVSKRIIPTENRWDKYVNKIQNWKIESLDNCFVENTRYYVFGDYSERERIQLNNFPKKDNIYKIIIKNNGWNHKVALRLKELGVLYDCISGCFNLKSDSYIKSIVEASSSESIEFLPSGLAAS